MYSYSFGPHARKDIKKLPKNVQVRLIKKLDLYIKQKDILRFCEPLTDRKIGEFRFRIGDYRVVFDIEGDELVILRVGHRGDINEGPQIYFRRSTLI